MSIREAIDVCDRSQTDSAAASSALGPLGGRAKRATDFVLAILILVSLSPLLLIVAAIIKTTDRGPLFFGHTRVGYGGRPFKCLKFRTMVTNSAEALQELLERDRGAAQEWAETQKLRNDPRVTPIGGVLRKLSIDELPQLWNVIRGDMSLVGPRPIVHAEMERYGVRFTAYQAARPGITGLWQVSGRSDASYAQRVGLDATYAATWSLWQDFAILARTAVVVAQRKGSC